AATTGSRLNPGRAARSSGTEARSVCLIALLIVVLGVPERCLGGGVDEHARPDVEPFLESLLEAVRVAADVDPRTPAAARPDDGPDALVRHEEDEAERQGDQRAPDVEERGTRVLLHRQEVDRVG